MTRELCYALRLRRAEAADAVEEGGTDVELGGLTVNVPAMTRSPSSLRHPSWPRRDFGGRIGSKSVRSIRRGDE